MRRGLVVPVLVLALSSLAAPATAAGTNGWAKVSQGAVDIIAVPGLARTPDGSLHVGYVTEDGADKTARQVTLAPSGSTGGTATIAGPWATINYDPKLLATPGGLTAILGGQQSTSDLGHLYAATSGPAGLSWSATTPVDTDYRSDGTGAVLLPGGTVLTARPGLSGVVLTAGSTTRTITPASNPYNASLVVSAGAVYLAYVLVDKAPGLYVQQIDPTTLAAVGAPSLAPGSSTDGAMVFTAAAEPTPLVARPDGSVWTAYCVGYPTCHATAVWRVGSAAPTLLPSAADNPHVALSATSDGRLWVAWNRTHTTLSAVRSNPAATAYGPIRTVPLPYDTLYDLAADGTPGPLDVVVNAGQGIFHLRIAPGLSAKAKPKHWKRARAAKVKVTVTDAGSPVKGAKVKAKGKGSKAHCTTHTKGTCTLRFKASKRKGKVKVTVTRASYAAASLTLRKK